MQLERGLRRPAGLALCAVLAACVGRPLASNGPSPVALPSGAVALASVTPAPHAAGCIGMGHNPPWTLHGDPNATPSVWAETGTEQRVPIFWPPGFYAQFDPSLEVSAPTGQRVAREGADLTTDDQVWPGLVICAFGDSVDVFWLSALANPT